MHLQGLTQCPSFMFHSSLLTAKSVNLVVAYDGFTCIMEIVLVIYKGAFQIALDSYCCVTGDNKSTETSQNN